MEASPPASEPPANDPVKTSNRRVLYILGGLLAIILIVVAVLLLTKKSEEEKALEAVCGARAGIQQTVDKIASTGLDDFTVNGFKEDVNSIRADINTIRTNEEKLGVDRKAQIQSANQQFTTAVGNSIKKLGTELSVNNVKAAVQQSGEELVTAYQTALKPIDCSGV